MRGHIAKKGNRYYAVIYEGIDPGTGKGRHRWHAAGSTRKEAERVLADLVKRHHDGDYRVPEKITLGEYLDRWLKPLDPRLAEPVVRYEKTFPGEQVHVDIKAFTRIPNGDGWKAWGRGNATGVRGIGKTYLHSMVDDHSRLAYSEFCNDQTAITCLEYTKRAVQWFADHGVTITEIMTDNGSGYRAHLFHDTVESVGIRHIYTRPYRPQTNGKVERFQQTLDREWAAARLWTSNRQREADLERWLHRYNHHRYHSAVKGAPVTRVNNLRDHYS